MVIPGRAKERPREAVQASLAGLLGFEPRRELLESSMIPFHHRPKQPYFSRIDLEERTDAELSFGCFDAIL